MLFVCRFLKEQGGEDRHVSSSDLADDDLTVRIRLKNLISWELLECEIVKARAAHGRGDCVAGYGTTRYRDYGYLHAWDRWSGFNPLYKRAGIRDMR